jgi:hypothetical protein
MRIIPVLLFIIVQLLETTAHADCENLLQGLRVESEFAIGDPWKATYFSITSNYLRANTVVSVQYDRCTTEDCKSKLDLISNAKWEHQALKFSVDQTTCQNIWTYFILILGGGTAEFLPIEKIQTVQIDHQNGA